MSCCFEHEMFCFEHRMDKQGMPCMQAHAQCLQVSTQHMVPTPLSVWHMQILLVVGHQYCGDGWSELEWGVRTGGLCFEKQHGAPFFEHLATVPGAEAIFSKAMRSMDDIGEWPTASHPRTARF